MLPLSSNWMVWNLFLALIPLVLSALLFRAASTRSAIWWTALFAFVAFLPNAPYVLTDLIHLVSEIQSNDSLLFNTLVLLPKYALFVLIGFEAYVLALINLGYYLNQQGLERFVLQIELMLHGLSAIGVYLGRIERFNSWDLMTNPRQVIHSVAASFMDQRPLLFMVIGFAAIAGLYWILKQISLAIMLKQQYARVLHQLSVNPNSSNAEL